jgi:hypothetical protein
MKSVILIFGFLLFGCGSSKDEVPEDNMGCEVGLKVDISKSGIIEGVSTSYLSGRGGEECGDYLYNSPSGGIDFSLSVGEGYKRISEVLLCDELYSIPERRGTGSWKWSELYGKYDTVPSDWTESEWADDIKLKDDTSLPRDRAGGSCEFAVEVKSLGAIIEKGSVRLGPGE